MPDPRPLPSGPLHFVGIGGAGMSALAFVLASRGQQVSGSDPGIESATKTRLESAGCTITPGPHAAANVPDGVAALIVTDAVKGENPEVTEAERRGIPIFKRPEALGSIVNAARTAICIAGTHGKTTTTGMVASILIHAGLNPTVLIGGDLPLIGGNACNGDPDLVVAEACEAYGGLDWLKPSIAVILNMEPDHLDFHGSEEAFREAFQRFVMAVRENGVVYFNQDHILDLTLDSFEIDGNDHFVLTKEAFERMRGFGFDEFTKWGGRPEFFADDIQSEKSGSIFKIKEWHDFQEKPWLGSDEDIRLSIPGKHNVMNAEGAALAALTAGATPVAIRDGLLSFTGTGRRFERMGETANGVTVIDDYAHHPTEIRATLQGARQAYPDNRLVAIFQPHLPSRTRDFLDEFGDALANGGADAVYLTDIYLAREPKQEGLIELLAEKVVSLTPSRSSPTLSHSKPAAQVGEGKTPGESVLPLSRPRSGLENGRGGGGVRETFCTLITERFALPERLKRELQPGDVAIFMGAGNIREQAEAFLAL